MNKEQAIEKLNDIRCHVKETSAEEQALVMAIDALKAQHSSEGTTKDATSDLISRQAVLDIVVFECGKWTGLAKEISKQLKQLPPAQPEPAIPLSWIEKHIEWLKSLDNEFANLAAAHISVMVKKWRDEQGESN